MIYITGDLHGEFDRFTKTGIKKLKKGDTLIVCGDFGFVWNGSKEEKKLLEKIGKRKFNTLFVPGCHDNYDLLKEYPEEEWCGGKTRVVSGRLRQLCRGEIYTLEGKTFFAFGGGESTDEAFAGGQWWPDEQPTEEEEAYALANLEKWGNKVDYVVSHDAPVTIREFLNAASSDVNSRINTFLERVNRTVPFTRRFFGKLHQDRVITGRHTAVYLKVVPVEE